MFFQKNLKFKGISYFLLDSLIFHILKKKSSTKIKNLEICVFTSNPSYRHYLLGL
jgi:hypothetical protein